MEEKSMEALSDLAIKLGIPGASLLFLLWWVTRSLNGKLDRMSSHLAENTKATSELSQNVAILSDRMSSGRRRWWG